MKRRVIFTELAEADLDEAFEYLWPRSPQAAVGFLRAARTTASVLAKWPGMGRRWEHEEKDLPDVRSVHIDGYKAWLMIYRDRHGAIHVLRIVHGARDLDAGLDLGNEINL